jgi:zona occludens toxin (predicted ATPase)
MIISGGNESKITKSKSIIVYTLIGLVIIFSSYLIIDFTIKSIGGTASVEETQDLPTAPGG